MFLHYIAQKINLVLFIIKLRCFIYILFGSDLLFLLYLHFLYSHFANSLLYIHF